MFTHTHRSVLHTIILHYESALPQPWLYFERTVLRKRSEIFEVVEEPINVKTLGWCTMISNQTVFQFKCNKSSTA